MLASLQNAKLSWNDAGNPISDSFEDIYFSNNNGLHETQYVFLKQNNLPERWLIHDRDFFVIAETGFGTGLNFLATWHAFRHYRKTNPEGKVTRLHFISFEKFPLTKLDLTQALAVWPELSLLSEQLISAYPYAVPGCQRLRFDDGSVVLDLWLGDVNELLPQVYEPADGLADVWFLDGFAPSKNPDMWTENLFSQVYRLSRPLTTLSTFTAAGFVRRGLANAGFVMSKVAGHGEKHSMLVGRSQKTKKNVKTLPVTSIAIVGGGIASACLTYLLTLRGFRVELFCADNDVAEGASGNPQGAIYPLLHQPNDLLSQFFVSAFHFCQQLLTGINSQTAFRHDWCGVLLKAIDDKSSQKNSDLLNAGFPGELIQQHTDGVLFPYGGWVVPAELVKALFQLSAQKGLLTQHKHCEIKSLSKNDLFWQLSDTEGNTWSASHVILANGVNILDFEQTTSLPITPMRGQISTLCASDYDAISTYVVCGDGYIVPALDGQQVIGATYVRNDMSREVRLSEHDENKAKMQRTLPPTAPQDVSGYTITSGRASIRGVTRDHFPLIGGFRSTEDLKCSGAEMPESGWLPETASGLFILAGMGSRGLCSAPWSAEIMASLLLNEPLPCSLSTLRNIDPHRRELRRAWKINLGNRRD
nr:bifunctional tRNA (5-methylaminomethyl-2-thiouridine)(34)-methyltransferase MnmD/FAD-dependent 5-carboxymethylaminomethyl-2-thiouridine(34) oxidoreductase MnmC [uncultured Tolumonas sp.]